MLTNCYLCNTPLTEPYSKEHLIPESLGGVSTSPNLLCGSCNNGKASQIDAVLFEQVGYLYRLVVQARHNIPVNALTISYQEDGTRVEYRGELHPRIPVTTKLGDMRPIHLATTKADARKDVRKILLQIKKGKPALDVDAALDKLIIIAES